MMRRRPKSRRVAKNTRLVERRHRLTFEVLEQRRLLTVTWTNLAGGDWDTKANWSSGAVPGSSDDVTIPALNAGAIVTHSQNTTDAVNSISAAAPITLSAGTLNVAAAFSDSSRITLAGGALGNATVQTGTTLQGSSQGGTLSSVVLAGTLDLTTAGNVNVTVVGPLTLSAATVSLGNSSGSYGRVLFSDLAASLAGTGSVDFSNGSNSIYNSLEENASGGSLNIGAGITINGGSGSIGYNPYYGSGPSNVSVVNQGQILAGSAGTVTINGSNWTNPGAIQASSGGSLTLAGSWSSSGVIGVTGGGTLALNGAWSNTGTISETSSTVNLGGTFTLASMGTFNRSGGAVNLTGTLTNTGSTLALSASTGSWNLLGGTIAGGVVSVSGGAALVGTNSGGTLSGGVTLQGDASLPVALDLTMAGNANVLVSGGALTLNNATVSLGNSSGSYGRMLFSDLAASLAGTGSVVFSNGSNSLYNSLEENASGGSLNIGAGITINGGSGSIGYNPYYGSGPSNVSVVNQGQILAGSAGTVTINGSNWTNPGAIQASSGGSLTLAGSWSSSGVIGVTGGGTLALNGAWSNTGTISETSSTVNLGGTFTLASMGTFNRSGGAVNLTGTLTNTGSTLALSASTGSWNLLGGTIAGGVVSVSGSAAGRSPILAVRSAAASPSKETRACPPCWT